MNRRQFFATAATVTFAGTAGGGMSDSLCKLWSPAMCEKLRSGDWAIREPTGIRYTEQGVVHTIRNPYLNFYVLQAEITKRLGPWSCKLLFD